MPEGLQGTKAFVPTLAEIRVTKNQALRGTAGQRKAVIWVSSLKGHPMKPSDIYLGVIDLFSILLPGAILTGTLLSSGIMPLIAPILPPLESQAANWTAYALAAYAVGHLVFLAASRLDDCGYDRMRRRMWPDMKGDAYDEATQLRIAMIGQDGSRTLPMNTFAWARALLMQQSPAAAHDVHRYEADSKFFRSLVVVLLLVCLLRVLALDFQLSLVTLALAAVSYFRYVERRSKSTLWAYRHIVVLLKSRTSGICCNAHTNGG